jgi:hypothetical protein
MKRKLNSELLNEWISTHGGHMAEAEILKVTGYSLSTLQKMKEGSYPSTPGFAERSVLVELTKIEMDKLFPEAGAKGRAS